MDHLNQFLQWVSSLPEGLVYLFLGLSAFVENVFPPIPGDTITAFGAFLVGTRRLSFAGVYVSTTLGSLLGFMSLYQIGAILGRRFFLERGFWVFKAQDILRAETWFQRYGYWLIAMNRFFPGIRSAIALMAGFSRLKAAAVTPLALLSAALWNLIWILMGYLLGTNWETVRNRIEALLGRYNAAILILFGLAALVLLALHRRRLKR